MASSGSVDDYPMLSRPVESIQPEYDVVVVGSGYGAGVAACRMARAGKSVAVLELGWERRPGTYPHTLTQCLRHMRISGQKNKQSKILKWFPSGGLHGATRFFQLFLGDGQHVFKAHGLGGCSLINAGVFLEADKATLNRSAWPPEIREDASSLQQYYARAADMLEPSPFPEDRRIPQKLSNLQEQFAKEECYRAPLTTCFTKRRNRTGIELQANTGSGQEATGLNDGSKNSVAVTYLADAWNWGAEIFCGTEVLRVEPAAHDGGYIVHFVAHGRGREQFHDEFMSAPLWVKAKEFCFLGAGSVGTTEILLRSKQSGVSMSPLVGKRMSGNGDLLLFGYNGRKDINGVSQEHFNADLAPGPVITGAVDCRGKGPSGYIIQDGTIPEPFSPVIQFMLITQTFMDGVFSLNFWRLLASIKSLLFGAYVRGGAIMRTATYLVISHDSGEMSMSLETDRPMIKGPAEGRSKQRKLLERSLSGILKSTGAKMGYSYFYGKQMEEITVHPLGGAIMSRDGTGREGVVNHLGEVFAGHGSDVYPGLVCCDASIIPTSLSVNPLATISAVAERNLHLMSAKYDFSIDYTTTNGKIDSKSVPRNGHTFKTSKHAKLKPNGWRFTEFLKGAMQCFPASSDAVPYRKERKYGLTACLTVELAENTHRSNLPSYQAKCTGTVTCSALSSAPLLVSSGQLNFFRDHEEAKTLSYNLDLCSVEGDKYYLKGNKTIDSRIFGSVSETWRATTTVDVVLSSQSGREIAKGQLKITPANFLRQLMSFRSALGYNMSTVWTLAIFLLTFAYHILAYFLRPFSRLNYPLASPDNPVKQKREASIRRKLVASDGVEVLIEVYDPEGTARETTPILFLPGVTGVGAEHQVYVLPYIDCNMVDYFTARGHRCYVLTPRWGSEYAVAERSTVYNCRLDIAAAVDFIGSEETEKPYVIAHCQGSVALAMALLTGIVQADDLLGITANSVFMNQVFAYWNGIKGRTTALIRLYEFLAGNFFPMFSEKHDAIFQQALDQVLRLYPVRRRRDICSSTACHRTSFGFGLLWNHRNLNAETHQNIHRFFAGTHTKLLAHVVGMGTRGEPMDNIKKSLLTDENLDRLRGLPILFISGSDNEVFDPETTLRDYEMFRLKFGERHYRRFVADQYGHLDTLMGQNAHEDVWWRIETHLKETLKLRKEDIPAADFVSESTSPAESVA